MRDRDFFILEARSSSFAENAYLSHRSNNTSHCFEVKADRHCLSCVRPERRSQQTTSPVLFRRSRSRHILSQDMRWNFEVDPSPLSVISCALTLFCIKKRRLQQESPTEPMPPLKKWELDLVVATIRQLPESRLFSCLWVDNLAAYAAHTCRIFFYMLIRSITVYLLLYSSFYRLMQGSCTHRPGKMCEQGKRGKVGVV
jgi:hypothetical protein